MTTTIGRCSPSREGRPACCVRDVRATPFFGGEPQDTRSTAARLATGPGPRSGDGRHSLVPPFIPREVWVLVFAGRRNLGHRMRNQADLAPRPATVVISGQNRPLQFARARRAQPGPQDQLQTEEWSTAPRWWTTSQKACEPGGDEMIRTVPLQVRADACRQ